MKKREANKIMKKKTIARQKSAQGQKGQSHTNSSFTDAELSKFAKAYEEGYDITTNKRYNVWLEVFHGHHSDRNDFGSGMCTLYHKFCAYNCV